MSWTLWTSWVSPRLRPARRLRYMLTRGPSSIDLDDLGNNEKFICSYGLHAPLKWPRKEGFIVFFVSFVKVLFSNWGVLLVCNVVSYESFSSKWELPCLPPSSLELWRKERAKRQLSFWWKILILIGHYGSRVVKRNQKPQKQALGIHIEKGLDFKKPLQRFGIFRHNHLFFISNIKRSEEM